MSVDRQRLKDIFFAALDQPRERLSAYLEEVCGNDGELRAEVESLLAHHDDAPLIDESVGTIRSNEALATNAESSRYSTLHELGAGGFGIVTQRFDRILRRLVASKSPRLPERAYEHALLREARLLAYLDHPGVVQVYDLHEGEPNTFYTMELVEGESLEHRLADLRANDRAVPISEALRIVTRVCETVANAHAKGVLHLDIKPANVMLQPFGHVSLIDWGMACFYDLEPYRVHLARAGEMSAREEPGGEGSSGGTPVYMPPEQFDTSATLGPAADVYAIGALLFEILIGHPPFEQRLHVPALLAAKNLGAPPVRNSRPEISERLGSLCAQMLDPSPSTRPASIQLVLDELAALSSVSGGTDVVRLTPGDVLFEEGAKGTSAYQVLSGDLEIVIKGEVVATRGTGDIVGELAMLSNTKRSATVRAKSAVVARIIDWTALEDELSKVDPLVGHLLRKLSDKLVETTLAGS